MIVEFSPRRPKDRASVTDIAAGTAADVRLALRTQAGAGIAPLSEDARITGT
jgi:hypothetical protein